MQMAGRYFLVTSYGISYNSETGGLHTAHNKVRKAELSLAIWTEVETDWDPVMQRCQDNSSNDEHYQKENVVSYLEHLVVLNACTCWYMSKKSR